ncbi:MAG: hypothetical protein LC676_19510 [Loktanella sp.]|nr:hypothetical protein [Loktanella sp.]
MSAILHVLGLSLAGFASESLFLLFPAALYSLLSVGLLRNMAWVAWVTLACMIGGIVGTFIEFAGPLMAPASVLIGIILADSITAGLLIRGLWHSRERREAG